MDLALTADERAFQAEVRAFLDEALTPELREAGRLGASAFSEPEHSLPWQRKLYEKGWVAPGWPREYGGAGWSEMRRAIFSSECARAGAPSLSPMGLRMVGPCIMGYGTADQKAYYLPRILAGQDYWCQGYSEPGSGSDLASLQMRADSDGDDYVLNGSKIWITQAHHANRMFCLVRTKFDGKPQQGITFLLLEMNTPGITVKPIVTLAGDHEVNQVFFDDVRVPKSGRLGEENRGWTVAKYLLEFERGGGSAPGLKVALARANKLRHSCRQMAAGTRRSRCLAKAAPVPPSFGFDASTPETVVLRFTVTLAGHRSGGRCVAGTTRHTRAGARCTTQLTELTLSVKVTAAGSSRVALTRAQWRLLHAGATDLTATAAGATSALAFTVR